MNPSTSTAQNVAWKLMLLSVALCSLQLTSASTNLDLTEERIRLAESGVLKYNSLSESEKTALFEKYEKNCDWKYSCNVEKQKRYGIFKNSLIEIDASNIHERSNNGSATYGVTQFSDLTDSEFKATFLGTSPPAGYLSQRRLMKIAPAVVRPLATSADWRNVYTTPIKYQGGCGSCWAFSAVAQIESDAIKAGHATTGTILSAQQMVKCTYDYDGCLGGFTQTGYGYVAKAGGITTEALYPYDVTTSYCDKSKNNYAVTVTMSYRVDGEAAMISQVLNGRTLSISLDANNMGNYKSGIYSGCGVNYNVNHAMNIVGVNVDEGYWILRNSWGEWWGDKGYMKLAMGSNMCGINNYATYTDTALPSGVPSPVKNPSQTPTAAPVAANIVKPVSPPTPAPVVPPTPAPVVPPTPAPVVPPTPAPVVPPTPLPSAKPVVPPTPAPVAPPVAKPVTPPVAPVVKSSGKPSYRPSRRTRRPTRPKVSRRPSQTKKI